MSEPNERLSRNNVSDEEATSSGDSVVLSPRKEPKRQLSRDVEGKGKMLVYDCFGHGHIISCGEKLP